MKKCLKLLSSVVSAVLVIWLTVFVTDAVRTLNLKEPVFAITSTTDNNTSCCTYKGIGYIVEIEKNSDTDSDSLIVSAEMKMFGKVVAAVIT